MPRTLYCELSTPYAPLPTWYALLTPDHEGLTLTRLERRIALLLRHRPLVLPLLLATVCLDLVLVSTDSGHIFGVQQPVVLWAALWPQMGLLSLWSAEGGRYWSLRLGISALAGLFFSIAFYATDSGASLNEIATIIAFYYGVVLVAAILLRLIRARFSPRTRRTRRPQYSVGQLLIVMTVLALCAGGAQFAEWRFTVSSTPYFLLLLSSPIAVCLAYDLPFGALVAFALCLGAGIGAEVIASYVGNATPGCYLAQYAFCAVWLWGVRVGPDPRRRRAARQRRRAPRLSLVELDPEADPREAREPEMIDTRV